MKKLGSLLKKLAIALAVLIALTMVFGGGSSDKKEDTNSDQSAVETSSEESTDDKKGDAEEEATEETAEEESNDGPSIATNSKYSVTINGFKIVEDYDGAPCIAVDYTFTNVSDDDPTSMQVATNITVYQNGVECEDAWLADGNSDGYTNKVKAGVSVDVTRVYKLQDTTSEVEVEVAPLFSWSDDLLAYQVFQLS